MQPPSWLYGLQDYFDFTDDANAKLFVDQLISVYFASNKANSVKNLCLSDTGSKDDKLSRFNFYFKLLEDESVDFVETISIMRKRLSDVDILDIFHKYGRNGHDMVALSDAFSRGQVNSKIWLVQELEKIKNSFEMIHVHAGWYGQIRYYLDSMDIGYNKMRIFDIDPTALEISDKIFNNDKILNFQIKSANVDITDPTWLFRTGCEYEITPDTKEKTVPDLVVNTSAEHFDEDWYHKFVIRTESYDPLFVIQTNNLFDIPEHINCVHSVDEMLKKFPMSRIEYAGEKEMPGYKRFMLIGRP